jgi:transcriptional regulator with XRE-family HTH domain
MIDGESVGARMRRYRRSRGLSLDQAAGLSGVSKSYLSRLERGERSVDSRALLLRIASALEVSVSDLTGQPYLPRDRQHADAHRGVAGIRLALLDPSGPLQPEAQVADMVDSLPEALSTCDLVAQARLIPGLLRWTQQHALAGDSPERQRRLATVAHTATFFLRNLGELDLAVMAAERMVTAARQSEDPATIGFAAFTQAHALAPAGAVLRAAAVAREAAESSWGPDPEELAARGSCLLVAASTSAALGDFDSARAQISAADGLAAALDVPTIVASHTSFSEWNARMYRVAVEVEAGNPSVALETAKPLVATGVGQRERMSYFWVDVGRAYSQLDRHREAIDAFRRAERAAPLRVRLSPVVRDSVRELMDRAHRRAAGVELRGLAERCGVLAGP